VHSIIDTLILKPIICNSSYTSNSAPVPSLGYPHLQPNYQYPTNLSDIPYGTAVSSQPVPRPYQDISLGIVNRTNEKAELVEKLKGLVNAKHKKYILEAKKAVANLQKVEEAINKDYNTCKSKRMQLEEYIEDINKKTEEVKEAIKVIKDESAKSKESGITKLDLIKDVEHASELHKMWIDKEKKRRTIESCMQVLKKYFENKSIPLNVFIDNTQRLAAKEFGYIYKKNKYEKLIEKGNN